MKKFLSFLVVVLLLISNYAFAESEKGTLSDGSLAVSPFLIELDARSGEVVKSSIEIFNTSDFKRKLGYSIQDFVPAGEHGQVRFLPVGEFAPDKYSLSSWISVAEQPEFEMPPRSQTKIEFQVKVPVDASSGSKYGGILFSFEEQSNQDSNILVQRKVGVLIIVRNGRGDARGELTTDTRSVYTRSPVEFVTRFKNTGNTHLAPKGEFYIYNWLGRLVTTVPINRDASLVLPETEREFSASLKKWLFGRFKVEALIYYGSEPKLEARLVKTIWIFPLAQTANSLATIFGVLVLLYCLGKLYNLWIIRRLETKLGRAENTDKKKRKE